MWKIWSIIFFSVLAFAQSVSLENGFKLKDEDPATFTVSTVDQKQADELFTKFAQDKDIPFKYPIDGCYARAHEMAKIAEGDGVTMGKVFAEGYLQVKTTYSPKPIVNWGWHVAPIAYVKNQDGKSVLMVFDPSLFTKPVTLDEWKQKMLYSTDDSKPYIDLVYYGDEYQYYARFCDGCDPTFREGYKGEWSQADWDNVKQRFAQYGPLQDFSDSTDPSADKKSSSSGVSK